MAGSNIMVITLNGVRTAVIGIQYIPKFMQTAVALSCFVTSQFTHILKGYIAVTDQYQRYITLRDIGK